MTRYKKHMQKVHNQATATSIEMAVCLLIEDVIEHLVNNGVKEGAPLLKEIRKIAKYQYGTTEFSTCDNKH